MDLSFLGLDAGKMQDVQDLLVMLKELSEQQSMEQKGGAEEETPNMDGVMADGYPMYATINSGEPKPQGNFDKREPKPQSRVKGECSMRDEQLECLARYIIARVGYADGKASSEDVIFLTDFLRRRGW